MRGMSGKPAQDDATEEGEKSVRESREAARLRRELVLSTLELRSSVVDILVLLDRLMGVVGTCIVADA